MVDISNMSQLVNKKGLGVRLRQQNYLVMVREDGG